MPVTGEAFTERFMGFKVLGTQYCYLYGSFSRVPQRHPTMAGEHDEELAENHKGIGSHAAVSFLKVLLHQQWQRPSDGYEREVSHSR